ncbi:MAG TPA: 2-oxoacid:ferredoxin oxidoreductase subunit gamma [Firmicutes bacterium]|nr:2-oxoacid:ferredoxin oxidoreductase subunit gamma [Bacillota bacterium]
MVERHEVRLSGSGGQGMLLAGIILAEAAILADKNAVQSQSYGPEARGGASRSEVVISNTDIDYPKVTQPEIFMALTQEAYNKYHHDLGPNALLVVDESLSLTDDLPEKSRVVRVPIIESATETLKRPIVANIVALGVLVGASSIVEHEFIEKAVLNRVPRGTEELNRRALDLGFQLAAGAVGGNK